MDYFCFKNGAIWAVLCFIGRTISQIFVKHVITIVKFVQEIIMMNVQIVQMVGFCLEINVVINLAQMDVVGHSQLIVAVYKLVKHVWLIILNVAAVI